MSEYLNYSELLIVGLFFTLYALVHMASKGKSYMFHYLFGAVFIVLIYDAYNQFSDAQVNVKQFKRGASFKCYVGGGVYSSATSYKVSKKNGWEVENDFFIKESLAIGANKCEAWSD